MTKKKPMEEHERRGPKLKGNQQISFQLSPEIIESITAKAKNAGLTRSAWLERLLKSLE